MFSQFVLDCLFNKHVTRDGIVIYWRACVPSHHDQSGSEGYLWVFEDQESIHSYHTPENL